MFLTVRFLCLAVFFTSICERPSHAVEDEYGYEEFEHAGPPKGGVGRSGNMQRIYAGNLAKVGDFTFIIGIRVRADIADPSTDYEDDMTSICTGALVAAQFVLTASHCLPRVIVYLAAVGEKAVEGFSYSNVHFELMAGTTDMIGRGEDASRQRVDVSYPSEVKIHVHPEAFKFQEKIVDRLRGKLMKDFLLLELAPKKAFSLGKYVVPVPILKTPIPEMMGGNCKALGFGNQDDVKYKRDSKLYFIDVKVGGEKFCDQLRGEAYKKTYHLCAMGEGMRDTCAGDSGGPLVCGPPGGYFMTGVLSVGTDNINRKGKLKGCGDTNTSFSVYVYPGVVEDWIANITKEVKYVTLEVAEKLREHPVVYTPATTGPSKSKRDKGKKQSSGSSRSTSLLSTEFGHNVTMTIFIWALLLNMPL